MSYAFGWWDYEEIDNEPQMICRDSDERVVMVGDLPEPWLAKAIAEHPKRPADRWKRFEYRHEEFWFPLIVNWVPEEGRILVDYNLSSELWRLETNADTEHPPYGGWVRVDDMVPDAFWCWPGGILFNSYLKAEQLKMTWGICLIGKWSCNLWEPNFFSRETQMLDYFSIQFEYGAEWFEGTPDDGRVIKKLLDLRYKDFLSDKSPGYGYPVSFTNDQTLLDNDTYLPRILSHQISDQVDGGEWVYVFDTVESAQEMFDSFGARILLTDDMSKYGQSTFDSYEQKDFLHKDVADRWPFLLRKDGKAVICMVPNFDRAYQSTSFYLMLDNGSELSIHAYKHMCSRINPYGQNDKLGIFSILATSTQSKIIDGYFALAPCTKSWDSYVHEFAPVSRQIADAMHYWEGVRPENVVVDGVPILDDRVFPKNDGEHYKAAYKHLLGYSELYLLMGQLAGYACLHRYRQISDKWENG